MKYGNRPFVCTTLRMLDYLTSKGYHFTRTSTDKRNSHYLNWIYEDYDESFEEAVEEYFAQCRARRSKQEA